MQYYLKRRKGIAEKPAWALVGGKAFHECVREWETRSSGDVIISADAQAERFPHHLAEQTAAEILSSGVPLHEWRASGKASQAYPDKENRAWWLDKGPEMVAQYVLAQEGRESEVLRLADGETLALELGFMLRLPELPPLKGFVDQALYFPRHDAIIVRDFKSGASTPVDTFQLKVYRLALEYVFGITAAKWFGDYWQARKGEATKGVNLTDVGRVTAEVRYRTQVMDEAERAGYYPPNPGNFCSSCGVRPHCPAMSDQPYATWPARA